MLSRSLMAIAAAFTFAAVILSFSTTVLGILLLFSTFRGGRLHIKWLLRLPHKRAKNGTRRGSS